MLDAGVLAGPAFSEMLIALVGNFVAAVALIFGIYFRRHRRRDLVLGYFAFNVSLFAVAAALGVGGVAERGCRLRVVRRAVDRAVAVR